MFPNHPVDQVYKIYGRGICAVLPDYATLMLRGLSCIEEELGLKRNMLICIGVAQVANIIHTFLMQVYLQIRPYASLPNC